MRLHRMIQYTPAWWTTRAGKVTASNADRIITGLGAWDPDSKKWEKFLAEIVAEEMTGPDPNFFSDRPMTPAMRHGSDTEPWARKWYSQVRPDIDVRQFGGVESHCGRLWASPDGLIYPAGTGEWVGVLELKCPMPKTHLAYLLRGELPREYKPQCHFHLIITGRPFVEFVSYAERMDPLVVRVTPDEYTERCMEALDVFLAKLEYTRRLAGLAPRPGTPGGPELPPPVGVEEVHYGDDDYPPEAA